MRPWRPSTVAKGIIAVFAGTCAVWSWTQGNIWPAVGAFFISLIFASICRAAEEEIPKK